MKNKYLLLLLLVLVIKPLYAIDPFSLKGKTIIIPPRRVCSQYSCKAVGYGNIYNVKVLKKGKFSKNNKLDLDVYGKEIYVEDVVFFDKQDKNRAVCLVVLYEGQKIVLHYPLFVPPIKSRIYNQKDYFDYDPYSFLGDSIIGESSKTITYWTHNSIHPIIDVRLKLQDPSSLNLFVYDKNTIQQKDSIYHNQTVFIEPLRNSYKYRQKPLKYVGIVYPWIVNDFDYSQLVDAYSSISNNGQWTVLLDFTDNDRHYYFDANSDIAMLEKDYMEFCKQRSHCSYVDELTSIFVGKQVLYKGTKI